MRFVPLSPMASLAPFIGNGHLVAFNVGPDGLIYLVIALKPLDDRIETPNGASFVKTVPEEPQTYRVVGLDGPQVVRDVVIEDERFNIHDVQPLGEELLLVCRRSRYRGPGNYEKNGRVYSRDGTFAREILLGDGIQSVQVSSAGVIWTSYFDEGVFGNYGWEDPIGASGLVAWDAAGNKLYEFQPTRGLGHICDCYAMNVESDEDVWLCYYTEFPLVRLHRREIASVWNMPVDGSDAFAISDGYALFRGTYRERDLYWLFALGPDGMLKLESKAWLRAPQGGKLIADRVVGRAGCIHLVSNEVLYRVEVESVLKAIGQRQ
jgi:hypothetical protein